MKQTVGEREHEAPGLVAQPDLRECRDPTDGDQEGERVASGACPGGREHDRAEELDCPDGGQRQSVDREVEERVHAGEHDAKREQDPTVGAGRGSPDPPGPPPYCEDDRGGDDPQPRHPEHVDVGEEEHRESRAEVVEDGADQEVRRRRSPERGVGHRRMPWCGGLGCQGHSPYSAK